MTRPNPAAPTRRRLLVLCLAVALVVPLSGCTGLVDDERADEALPGPDEAAERSASLETLSATVRTVRRVDGERSSTVAAVKRRFDPLGYRSRVRSVDGDGSGYATTGHLTVANETVTILYHPERETVSYLAGHGDGEEDPYLDMVAAARENETIPRQTPGVPSLPRVPRDDDAAGNGSTTHRDQLVRVRYNGTETVDGRRTYRLDVDPVSPNASLKRKTVWLDAEYLYPLKRHVEFVANGDRYEFLTTYRNVTVNPDLPPGTFRLDPERLSADVERTWFRSYDSLSAAAANVTLPVPEPSVPEGYELERANHRSDDPEMLVLTYERRGDERPIRIAVVGDTHATAGNGSVEVGGHDARLGRHGNVSHVGWAADGYSYTVQGPLDNGTLVEIARSVASTT